MSCNAGRHGYTPAWVRMLRHSPREEDSARDSQAHAASAAFVLTNPVLPQQNDPPIATAEESAELVLIPVPEKFKATCLPARGRPKRTVNHKDIATLKRKLYLSSKRVTRRHERIAVLTKCIRTAKQDTAHAKRRCTELEQDMQRLKAAQAVALKQAHKQGQQLIHDAWQESMSMDFCKRLKYGMGKNYKRIDAQCESISDNSNVNSQECLGNRMTTSALT